MKKVILLTADKDFNENSFCERIVQNYQNICFEYFLRVNSKDLLHKKLFEKCIISNSFLFYKFEDEHYYGYWNFQPSETVTKILFLHSYEDESYIKNKLGKENCCQLILTNLNADWALSVIDRWIKN